ncbi:MAG TPA: DUF2791 family P-loop domain-containing protein [Spirochaetota bacterium]|nr:DUF2791 family P-loop domain-containing protein [Spirochaetota bacterium]HPQ48919.1 DUF2791 family P-loop domain-containing protein [Spirochaetota bacterium]
MEAIKNRFKILNIISTSEQSKVYKGIDLESKKNIAIKEIDSTINFYKDEINILKNISHPFILPLIDFVEENNKVYIITEWIEGFKINQISFSLSEWINIFLDILKTINFIHEKHIIHRDLKPSNILIDENNKIKIIDFGIAGFESTLTDKEKIKGTLPYMAPESTGYFKGNVTTKSDIYSLGVVFYECITGHNPFKAEKPAEIIHKHLSHIPDPIYLYIKTEDEKEKEILKKLDKIIREKMLQKEPNSRYEASQIIEELKDIYKEQFPLERRYQVFLREELVDKMLESLGKIITKNKGLLIIRGDYGSGKTFFLNKLIKKIKHKEPIITTKIFSSKPFSLIKTILEKLKYNTKDYKKILEIDLPIIVIEELQRIDESSLDLLLKKDKLIIIGTVDSTESINFIKKINVEKEIIDIKPYNKEEIKTFIDTIFVNNLFYPDDFINFISEISQGNLTNILYLLKFLNEKKSIKYQNNKWVITDNYREILKEINKEDIIIHRLISLPDEIKEFAKKISIFGFSISPEELKYFSNLLGFKLSDLKKMLKKSVEVGILEEIEKNFIFINKTTYNFFYNLTPIDDKIEKHLIIANKIEKLKNIKNKAYPLFYHYYAGKNYKKSYLWGNVLLIELIRNYSYEQAINVFEKIIESFNKMTDKTSTDFLNICDLTQSMVSVYIFKVNYDNIIKIIKEQIKILKKEINNKQRLTNAYINLGRLYSLKGEPLLSQNYFKLAEKMIDKESIDINTIKFVFESMCLNFLFTSDFKKAIEYFDKAKKFYTQDDYKKESYITFLGIISFSYANIGEYEKATECLKELKKLIEIRENPYSKMVGTHYTILTLAHMGHIEDFEEKELDTIIEKIEASDNLLLKYSLYFSVGYFLYKKNKIKKATEYIETSIKIAENLNIGAGILAPYLVLSEIAVKNKKDEIINKNFKNIIKKIKKVKDRFSYQWFLRLKALYLSYSINQTKSKKAIILINKAIKESRKLGNKPELARNYYYYSLISFNIGDIKESIFFEKKATELFKSLKMKWEENELKSNQFTQSVQTVQMFMGEKLKIETLSKISEIIAKQTNQNELFKSILGLAIEISGCNKGAFFLIENDKIKKECSINIEESFNIDKNLLEYIILDKNPYVKKEKIGSSLYMPIRFKEKVNGILYVENSFIRGLFESEMIRIMEILSSIFGVIIENSNAYRQLETEKLNLEKKVEERTKEVYTRNKIIERDLAATKIFHKNLMPNQLPEIKNLKGDIFYKSLEEIGGDFYDFIKISDTRMLFIIADSAGHGIRASLLTAMLKTSLYTYPDKTYSNLNDLIIHINESLYGKIMDKYVVAVIGIIDTEKEELNLIGGGNIVVFFFEKKNKQWQRINLNGHMLGIIPTEVLRLSTAKLTFKKGDIIFLATDGIPEYYKRDAVKGDRIVFGEEGIIKQLKKYSNSPHLISKAILKAMNEFCDNCDNSDDLTSITLWKE